MITLSEPSIQSVFIASMSTSHSRGQVDLGTGTGFFVCRGGDLYLVTNYHVASGRDPDTGQAMHGSSLAASSLNIAVTRPLASDRLEWGTVNLPVLETDADGNERALWLQHPAHGRLVDVVAIPVDASTLLGFEAHPYDLESGAPEVRLSLGMGNDVNIVGFPFGRPAGGAFAVWTHGFVASEPLLDYEDRPRFLIDARTREGQSGSPVITHNPCPVAVNADGQLQQLGGAVTQLVGVYSGRINLTEDIGFVWRAQAVVDIIDAKCPGRADTTL